MKLFIVGIALWSLLISSGPSWAKPQTEETLSGTGRGEASIAIPKEYGKLISVVESQGIHYLYFQDDEGNIRIFLLGIKGSAARARTELEALPHNVYRIPRSEPGKTDQ